MNMTFIRTYLTRDTEITVSLIEGLVPGFGVEHPQLHAIVTWPGGDRVETTRSALNTALLDRQDQGTIQFWQQEDYDESPEDFTCDVRFHDRASIIELNGLPYPPYEVLSGVWRAFTSYLSKRQALGLISDPHAWSVETDPWDAFVLDAIPPTQPYAELMCVPTSHLDRVEGSLGYKTRLGTHTVIWQRDNH